MNGLLLPLGAVAVAAISDEKSTLERSKYIKTKTSICDGGTRYGIKTLASDESARGGIRTKN